jgi:basic amino acid/polyamine antiporter, APA family
VHPRYRTPWIDTIIVGVVAAGFAGLMSLDALVDLTNVGSLAAFSIVCLTVLYLRFAEPALKRPFRTPLFPLVPVLGAAMCLFLLMSIMANSATRHFFLVYLVGGMVVYFLYGIRHSKLAHGELVFGAEPNMDLPRKLDV